MAIVIGIVALSGDDILDDDYQIKIIYVGSWSGAIGSDDSIKSIDGSGTQTYDLSGSIITATIQKDDDSPNRLTVQILRDGEVLEEGFTTAAYGVVTVSY